MPTSCLPAATSSRRGRVPKSRLVFPLIFPQYLFLFVNDCKFQNIRGIMLNHWRIVGWVTNRPTHKLIYRGWELVSVVWSLKKYVYRCRYHWSFPKPTSGLAIVQQCFLCRPPELPTRTKPVTSGQFFNLISFCMINIILQLTCGWG